MSCKLLVFEQALNAYGILTAAGLEVKQRGTENGELLIVDGIVIQIDVPVECQFCQALFVGCIDGKYFAGFITTDLIDELINILVSKALDGASCYVSLQRVAIHQFLVQAHIGVVTDDVVIGNCISNTLLLNRGEKCGGNELLQLFRVTLDSVIKRNEPIACTKFIVHFLTGHQKIALTVLYVTDVDDIYLVCQSNRIVIAVHAIFVGNDFFACCTGIIVGVFSCGGVATVLFICIKRFHRLCYLGEILFLGEIVNLKLRFVLCSG